MKFILSVTVNIGKIDRKFVSWYVFGLVFSFSIESLGVYIWKEANK